MKYKVYTQKTFKNILQMQKLTTAQIFDIEVLGEIFPFKVNNYVIDELIDWDQRGSYFSFNFSSERDAFNKIFR